MYKIQMSLGRDSFFTNPGNQLVTQGIDFRVNIRELPQQGRRTINLIESNFPPWCPISDRFFYQPSFDQFLVVWITFWRLKEVKDIQGKFRNRFG